MREKDIGPMMSEVWCAGSRCCREYVRCAPQGIAYYHEIVDKLGMSDCLHEAFIKLMWTNKFLDTSSPVIVNIVHAAHYDGDGQLHSKSNL